MPPMAAYRPTGEVSLRLCLAAEPPPFRQGRLWCYRARVMLNDHLFSLVRHICKKVVDKRTFMVFNNSIGYANRRRGDNAAGASTESPRWWKWGEKRSSKWTAEGGGNSLGLVSSDDLPPLSGSWCVCISMRWLHLAASKVAPQKFLSLFPTGEARAFLFAKRRNAHMIGKRWRG